MEGGRSPRRCPKWMSDTSDDEGSLHSNSSGRRRVSEDEADFKTLQSLLKSTITLKPDEELVIYEEEISDQEDGLMDDDNDIPNGHSGDRNGQVIELIEANEDEVEEIGLDNFHPPSDYVINTKPVIKIRKNSHISIRRINKIVVPPTTIRDTLHERFSEIQNKILKRHISPYFQYINYFRFKQESGFSKIANQLKAAQKLKKNAIRTSNNTVSGKLAEINNGPQPDFEKYWREQMDYWAEAFRWYKEDDREPVSREQLDKEIEEYMAQRGHLNTVDDLDNDLIEYMSKKGYVRQTKEETKEQLDHELDTYMDIANQTD